MILLRISKVSLYFIVLKFSAIVIAERLDFSSAIECRQSAVKTRNRDDAFSFAYCHIKEEKWALEEHNIFKTIHPDWQWTFNHEGSIAGQVFSIGPRSIEMISMIHCIDRGEWTGNRAEILHESKNNSFRPFKYLLDFDRKYEDPYMNCVKSRKSVNELNALNRQSKKPGKKLSSSPLRSIVKKTERNYSGTEYARNFSMNYTKHDINVLFDDHLKNISLNRASDLQFESNKPIIVRGYPFETGISFYHTNYNFSLLKDDEAFRRLPVLAWNLALKAKIEKYASKQEEAMYEEPAIVSEVLTIILPLLFASLAFVGFLWGIEKDPKEHFTNLVIEISRNVFGTEKLFIVQKKDIRIYLHSNLQVIVLSIGLLVSFVLPVTYLNQSTLKYKEFAKISQGGIVVYGKLNKELSLEKENPFAASDFSVAHWYVATFEHQGFKHLTETVLFMVLIGFIFSLNRVYHFSCYRENMFDKNYFFQSFFRIIIIPIVLIRRVILKESYESTFSETICRIYETFRKNDSVKCSLNNRRCIECNRFIMNNYIPDDIDKNSHYGSMKTPSWVGIECYEITRNEIEKAAEILTADRLGLLTIPQAIVIMSVDRVRRAANCFRKSNTLPGVYDLRLLAFVYYVEEVVVGRPEMIENIKWRIETLENIIVDNEITDLPIYAEESKTVVWILSEEKLSSADISGIHVLVKERKKDRICIRCNDDRF